MSSTEAAIFQIRYGDFMGFYGTPGFGSGIFADRDFRFHMDSNGMCFSGIFPRDFFSDGDS